MSKARITWTDPSARVVATDPVGTPFLSEVDVFVSTDNGVTYNPAGHAAAGQQTFDYDLPTPGTYLFKLEAVDAQSPPVASADSVIVSVVNPEPALSAPLPPSNVAATLVP